MSALSKNQQISDTIDQLDKEKEKYFVASQWRLMWAKLKRHRLALGGSVVIAFFYTIGIFAGFIAPHNRDTYNAKLSFAPPQRIHFFDEDGFHLRPFVYAKKSKLELSTLTRTFTDDKSKRYDLHFFVRGDPYRFWGFFHTNLHLFGTKENEMLFLFGTDKLGRDLFSMNVYATRMSLSIGLVGVFLAFVLGIILGGISGFYAGTPDLIIQRIIEFVIALPTIPLWMTLSVAMPRQWSIAKIYFGITIILSLFAWAGLARVTRGKILELREEDFVMAARLSGSGISRMIFRHLMPSFMSYLIVHLTLAVPGMIIAETALSFLHLGLRPPAVSWGVLISNAQNVRAISLYPWLLIPGLWVVLIVLAFNFVGDGLRDAADPYKR